MKNTWTLLVEGICVGFRKFTGRYSTRHSLQNHVKTTCWLQVHQRVIWLSFFIWPGQTAAFLTQKSDWLLWMIKRQCWLSKFWAVLHNILFDFSDRCMEYNLHLCNTTCEKSQLLMADLYLDGKVCPFQYFCKCSCPYFDLLTCMQSCLHSQKHSVNDSVDKHGCRICTCSSAIGTWTGPQSEFIACLSFRVTLWDCVVL